MKRRTIWRKKRGGKFYGNWYATIDGEDVNLGTKSATIAEKLLPEAERGRRKFESDAEAAAAALDQADAGDGGAGGGTDVPASTGGQTPSLPPAPPSPPAQEPAPAQQPPAQETPEEAARAEAEATNAAAAETAGASSPANDNAAAAVPAMPPEVLDGFLRQAGAVMVDVQLYLQAWGIKRATGKIAGEIPPTAAVRGLAAEAWTAQFKIWFPADTMLPPWAMALVLTAMCAPVQLATAKDPPKEDEKPADDAGQAAA